MCVALHIAAPEEMQPDNNTSFGHFLQTVPFVISSEQLDCLIAKAICNYTVNCKNPFRKFVVALSVQHFLCSLYEFVKRENFWTISVDWGWGCSIVLKYLGLG